MIISPSPLSQLPFGSTPPLLGVTSEESAAETEPVGSRAVGPGGSVKISVGKKNDAFILRKEWRF